MTVERAKEHLREYGRDLDVLEFDVSSATVELAAKAIECAPERIAKTLSFMVDDGVALIVCAGDARIANPKFKEAFHCKAKMVDPEKAEELIGHAVGGVCPFGVNDGCKIYLDESLHRFETVFPHAAVRTAPLNLRPMS